MGRTTSRVVVRRHGFDCTHLHPCAGRQFLPRTAAHGLTAGPVADMGTTAHIGQAGHYGTTTARLATWGTLLHPSTASGHPPALLRHTGGTQVVMRHLLPLPRATRWTAALPPVFAPLAPPGFLHPYASGV